MSWIHLQNWQFLWSTDAESLEPARELAERAIVLDDTLAEGHHLLDQIYLWRKEHDRAIDQAERAVAIAPNDAIIVDVVRYPDLWRQGSTEWPQARLHRWCVDVAGRQVREQPLDDRAIEFPRCDERRVGLAHRYGYAVHTVRGLDRVTGTALLKYDLQTAAAAVHDCGPGRVPGEAVFVPASAGAEDAGWVLAYVYDAGRDGSDLIILDAADFAAKPIATIELPQRVPYGFHGNWIPDPS